jgi:ABC-type multidrug transport system fused ATPase/permease subunit
LSAINGAANPIFGVVFSEIMNVLVLPLEIDGDGNVTNVDEIRDKTQLLCIFCAIIGITCFLASSISKIMFGTVGENVTLEIRKVLYKSILMKHIGFFDFRENGTSVLTSSMAEDTSIINGVSTESLGPAMDGCFALLVGLGIGFAFSWKISLICLAAAPIMAIGGVMEMQAAAGFQDEDGKKALAEANLLCGDAIVNYKTVQSFGHEELVVQKYVDMLIPIKAGSVCGHIMVGVGYGFTQFMQFAIFAGLFWFGAFFMERDPGTSSKDVFIAMFAIMFGAQQMGTAFAMGPDAGKAELAAQKVFRIIEKPSTINAIEMDEKK